LVAGAGVVCYFALRGPRDDLGRFQGEWELAVSAGTRGGRPVARPKPVTVRVTGDRWAFVADGKETARYAITLRPDASPKEIDLVKLGPDDAPTGPVSRGVYTIGAGRAKVVHAPAPAPRPAATDDADPNAAGTVWLLDRAQ
jgi:uncharacterized protein (TIGR03067 family)